MRGFREEDIQAFLPLQPAAFHILLAVADQERHGYAIMRDVAERSSGQFRLNPGTLYTTIRRLLEEGLIAEGDERPEPEHDDERRRYYGITKLGRAVAEAELARLRQLVGMAAAALARKA